MSDDSRHAPIRLKEDQNGLGSNPLCGPLVALVPERPAVAEAQRMAQEELFQECGCRRRRSVS